MNCKTDFLNRKISLTYYFNFFYLLIFKFFTFTSFHLAPTFSVIGNYLIMMVGANSFDLNWWLERRTLTPTFSTYTLYAAAYPQIRRFPMGRTENAPLQIIMQFIHETNTNTVTYDFDLICSYWKKESLYRPGFLMSFFEAPVVPLVTP